MKKIKVEEVLGMILAHDLTKIEPGKFKGAKFKKGHIITEEDIDKLKDAGKYHINVIELNENQLHEEEAAKRIANAIKGTGIKLDEPSEGKVSLRAEYKGLLKIKSDIVEEINSVDMVTLATMHTNSLVEENQIIGGTRVVPLSIDKSVIEEVEGICSGKEPIIEVKKLKNFKAGIVVTGTEVYEGRIKDKFGEVLENKAREYGSTPIGIKYAKDDIDMIENAIKELIEEGAELIMTSGGMSVDADDVTPIAIRNMSDEVISYGSPVLPGSMFMLAYRKDMPIIGVPACGMYHRVTVLDLILLRVLAGEKVSKYDMAKLGHGGLCLGCEVCTYPVCPFGK